MIEVIFVLYAFIAGEIYASWLFDNEESIGINALNLVYGFFLGWLITPILIGRAFNQIYKG